MLGKLRAFFAPARVLASPSLPPGERVYAIGDIHGRLDLFNALLHRIAADEAQRPQATTTIVLLGDLVDRGADSAGVLARARALRNERDVEILGGNHEEMFLQIFEDTEILRSFLRFGGIETLASYGIAPETVAELALEELQALIRARIPEDDLAFVRSFGKLLSKGGYVFVHAGVRPGVPLEMQLTSDCRWIREPFLSHTGDLGAFVIHGHTITQEPDERANRIGIDTGAYIHGTLTAIGLEGSERWFLTASDGANDGAHRSDDTAGVPPLPGAKGALDRAAA